MREERDGEAFAAGDNQQPRERDGGRATYRVRSAAVIGILALAILYTAYFAREILIPMALAFLFSLIFTPVVTWLARFRIPRPLSAALLLALLIAGFGFGAWGLTGPAMHWVKEAPHAVHELERKIRAPGGPLSQIQKSKEALKKETGEGESNTGPTPVKVVNSSSLMGRAASVTPAILTGIGIAIVLLYFLLAASDSFLRSLAHAIPRWPDKRHAVEVARNIQHHVARYLFTITLINLSVGLLDGVALWLIGMPNPILWGAMIALLNYVPYLGALIAIVVLTLIALLTFSNIGVVVVVPAVLLAVSILEGQFITPHVVGQRLSLSPVAVFITLVVCGWMWGIVGAIIAVPLLASFSLMCEQIESLNPIANFLTSYHIGKE